MRTFFLPLPEIPPEGRTIVVDDPSVWELPMAEFHMQGRAVTPLRVEVTILPTGDGWLARGAMSGSLVVPCDRCAEDALVTLDHSFEVFEQLPETSDDAESLQDSDTHIILEQGVPGMDLAALCWEEFVLALPAKPLCTPDCKGLCTSCGVNLNEKTCACPHNEGDPRLAMLRALKITTPGH